MFPDAWARYQTTLALAAFVAGCTIAEMQLRIMLMTTPRPPQRPSIRLVSDHYGFLVEKED